LLIEKLERWEDLEAKVKRRAEKQVDK